MDASVGGAGALAAPASDQLNSSSTSAAAVGGRGFASPQSVVTSASEANSKLKSALVVAAEAIDRRSALLSGYLRKHNSQGRWQKRYFESALGGGGEGGDETCWI